MSLFDDENSRSGNVERSQNSENFYYTGGMPPTAKTPSLTPHPWRRYFARNIDTGIYGSLWSAVVGFVFNVNLRQSSFWAFLDLAVVIVMMLLLEPLLISLFATTPGKAIFGIKVTAQDGRKLTYSEALDRTWGLFSKGMGYSIPIYNLVCVWRGYKMCKQGKTMPWDEEISFTIKDTRWWRSAVYILALIALSLVDYTVAQMQYLPPNRGEITVAEFAENYNYYTRFFGVDINGHGLDSNGRWIAPTAESIDFNLNTEFLPELEFELENGYVQSVSFFYELENQDKYIEDKLIMLSLSLVGAQKEIGPFSGVFSRIANEIDENPYGADLIPRSFDFVVAGVRMYCATEMEGYEAFMGYPESADVNYFSMEFSMTK